MILEKGRPLRRTPAAQAAFYLWGGFTAAGTLAVFLALWQQASLWLGDLVLPPPLPVLQRAVAILGQFRLAEIPLTAARAAVGVGLALLLGIGSGLLAGYWKTLGLFCRPLVSMLLGMPPIVWLVLALFWFGMGTGGVVFTITVTTLPLTFAAAMRGMLTIDAQLSEMLQAYQVPWTGRVRHLYLPHLLNQLLPAVSVAVGTGVKVALMAELLGAEDGMGARLAAARAMLDMQEVLAYVWIVLAMIFIVEYLIVEPLKILLMPWEQQTAFR